MLNRRGLILALLPLAVACSGGDGDDAGTTPDPDGGVATFDATVVDAAPRYDGGFPPIEDAGFADPATLLDGFQSIEGVRTYMRIRGTTTSTMPPVVVLNAGPMLGHEYQVEPLDFLLGPGGAEDPDRLLVFFDMRATGRSGFGAIGSSSVTIQNHVIDLDHLVDFVDDFTGRPGPVDFVANGYGSAVATLYAADHPERVSRMVFAAPYPSHVREQADWMAEWNSRLSSADRQRLTEITRWDYCLRDLQRCSRDTWNIMGPTWFCRENRSVFESMTFEHVEMRPFYFFTVIELRDEEFDHRPVMEQIAHPVTVIAGPCDPVPMTAAENYRDHLQNATLHVIPMTGHFPMTESPADYQRIVRAALIY